MGVLSNNEFSNIFNFIDKNSINVDKELIKNLFSYSYNSGALWSGTYNFEPCNSIDIEGLGDVGEEGILTYVVINGGSVNINGVYSNQFIDGEIKCICVFFNFDGSLIFDPDTKYSKLKGDADLGYLIEYSLLVSLDSQKSEFKRIDPISLYLENINNLTKKDITCENPHFFVYKVDFSNAPEVIDSELIYDEILQESWILKYGEKQT